MTSTSFVLGILVLIFAGDRVNGVKIQFYKNSDYTDLVYESNSTSKCTNTPADKNHAIINGIKTDTCLMVYYDSNCQCTSRKFDLDHTIGWGTRVKSFHTCNEDIGGHQLKIDINKYYDYNKPTEVPDVLERYKDVCACINVPKYVQNMSLWSINNYGNDFLAYYEPDCSKNKWNPTTVLAGFACGSGSTCMHRYTKTDSVTSTKYKIKSIGPNPNSKYFKASCKQIVTNNKIFSTLNENKNKLNSFQRSSETCQQKHEQDFDSLGSKDEELEKQIQNLLQENQVLKGKAIEFELKLESELNQNENKLVSLKNDVDRLGEKNHQLEQTIQELLQENQGLKEKAVETEIGLEYQYKNLEDSFEKLKDEFENSIKNIKDDLALML